MLPVMQTYIHTEENRVQSNENSSFCYSQKRRMIELIFASNSTTDKCNTVVYFAYEKKNGFV